MINTKTDFDQVYNLNKKLIYNLSLSFLNDNFESEDVVQDVFLKIYNLNKNFKSLDDIKYFLIRITINKCKNIIRNKKNKNKYINLEIIEIKNNYKKDNIYFEYDVKEIISILNYKYKEIIILKFIENLSNEDISRLLKISNENVRKRIERAKKILKTYWREVE